MTKVINLESLQRENKNYQEGLRALPAFLLEPFLKKFNMNLLEVEHKDVILHQRRRGALLKPYTGVDNAALSIETMKVIESVLSVDKCYIALKDNITNYKDKKVLVAAGNKVDNQNKKHPLEREILMNVVKTFMEDFVVCSFHAERDNSGTSPIDSFDGFFTKLLALIAAGEVSTAKGNLIETGTFATPSTTSDVAALTKAVAFFRALSPFAKSVQLDWTVPPAVLTMVRDALGNRTQNIKLITNADVAEYIKDNADLAFAPNICSHPVLGTGQRMFVTTPGNLSVGVNAKTDGDFVQVRAPYEDPNIVQFWMQGDFGTRFDDWDKKIFACNESASVANIALMGDYVAS